MLKDVKAVFFLRLVEEFADVVGDYEPQDIIDWAKREIKEYQKLIDILEKKKNANNH